MNSTGVLGFVAGVLTSSSLLPQLIKTIREKKVEDLSAGMFITLMIGIILWIIYGILKEDWPIIITNSFSVFLNVCILVLRYKYRKK